MTKFFFKFKKAYFWPIFGPFPQFLGAKNVSLQNLAHIKFSRTMSKFRVTWWSHSKKTTQQTAGWKDCQTLFHGTLLATARGPTSTTAVDWHLKVKDIEYHSCKNGLSKNCCLTVSMQKISRIHKLINSTHSHPQIIKITFSLHEFAATCKISVYSIN